MARFHLRHSRVSAGQPGRWSRIPVGEPAGGLLGVDVGGSGIRAGLIDRAGSLRFLVSRQDPGRGERFDPDLTWLAVASAIRELTAAGVQVRAVGVTAHLATVLTRPDGRPAADAMLWRDNRAWREAEELRALLGPELESVTGRPPSAESAAARMRMIAKASPAVLGRTRWLLSLKDYLTLQLTGSACTDPATASYTQLFDVRQRRWSARIVTRSGTRMDILPAVCPGVALAGRVTAEAARLTGLEPGTPVAVGGPDGSTGTLGVGAVRAGLTADIAGTTDVLLHVTDSPPGRLSGGAVLNAYLLDGLWTVGGPTGLTGGGLHWLASTLGHDSVEAAYQALEDSLDAADPGELMIRTTLTGRRLPRWDAGLRGRIEGISGEHGPAHLMRAAEEGSAFEVRLGLEALRSTGAEVSSVIMAGGHAISPRAAQLRANAWDVAVDTAAERHASLRGAALAAAVGAGLFADAGEAAAAMVPRTRRYEPDPDGVAVIERRYQRWRVVMALPVPPARRAREGTMKSPLVRRRPARRRLKHLAIDGLERAEALHHVDDKRIPPRPARGEPVTCAAGGKAMSRPVHVSIRDDLRSRIDTGEWGPGARLPSEAQLAAWYGVARMTIRQAIGALASEGAVVRRQGLGTFASARRPTRSVDMLLSFTEEMHRQGREVQTRLITATVEPPPSAARRALRPGQPAAAVAIRRVRLVDGCPIIVQHSWLPYARFAGLADADPLLGGSLYAMLEARYGVRITRAKQAFAAEAASESDALALGLQRGEPVLRISRTTYDSSNLVVEFATSAMRPGYSIETFMERKAAPDGLA
jgi:xylulokinase